MDETTCMVRACQRIARFYVQESCGQCTPCREGTGWMYRMLTRIVDGHATVDDLQMLRAAAGQIEGHTICAFGEAAAWPVQGFLRHYWNEFRSEEHTSELQSLMRISYAVFCLKKKKKKHIGLSIINTNTISDYNIGMLR